MPQLNAHVGPRISPRILARCRHDTRAVNERLPKPLRWTCKAQQGATSKALHFHAHPCKADGSLQSSKICCHSQAYILRT